MHQHKSLSGSASFGVDIGHSSIKISVAMMDNPSGRGMSTFPTVVTQASKIADENTARIAARDTVDFDGKSYFIGETAVLQGNVTVFSGQERDWINTKTHDVLMIGAWKKAIGLLPHHPKSVNLVLGLPMAFYSAQKNELRTRIQTLLAPYLLEGQTLRILVRPQSIAPLINRQHLPSGVLNPDYQADKESWAVIDIGHFTTDFAVLLRTQIREVAGESIPGVSTIYSAITSEFQAKGYPVILEAIDEAIKTKQTTFYGQVDVTDIIDAAVQPLRDIILDNAKTLIGDVAGRLTGLIVAGGGAPLVFDAVKAVYRNAILDNSPNMSVSEGLCRFGLFAHHERAETVSLAA